MDSQNYLITESSFSEGFKTVLLNENINTIAELLNLSKEQLTSIPNFTFKMLVEYREFLEANNLESK